MVERVDWPCRVERNYSDVNLGCGVRPATGISWVFEQVEEAILLEDDCLPHPTFFRYCDELLERYRDDERIMNIAGTDWQFGRRRSRYSYWFSMFNITGWGWASWRRAWRHYDRSLRMWPELRETSWLEDKVGDPAAAGDVSQGLRCARTLPEATWTTGTISGRSHAGLRAALSILPSTSLVSNIGFGPDATHTFGGRQTPAPGLREPRCRFPSSTRRVMVRDHEADRFIVEHVIWPQLGVSPGTSRPCSIGWRAPAGRLASAAVQTASTGGARPTARHRLLGRRRRPDPTLSSGGPWVSSRRWSRRADRRPHL